MFGMSVALLRLVLWSFFNIPMPDELRSRCISGGVAVRNGGGQVLVHSLKLQTLVTFLRDLGVRCPCEGFQVSALDCSLW